MKVEFSLSAMYLTMYQKDKKYLKDFIECTVPRETLLKVYSLFVKEENILPIEKLPELEKVALVNECRETGINFTNINLINSAKILHTLKFINANS